MAFVRINRSQEIVYGGCVFMGEGSIPDELDIDAGQWRASVVRELSGG